MTAGEPFVTPAGSLDIIGARGTARAPRFRPLDGRLPGAGIGRNR
jgi:hypothetical protein